MISLNCFGFSFAALASGPSALPAWGAAGGLRRVIDLSGDGRNNDGTPLRRAREEVLSHQITINGLAILNELPLLEKYFQSHLIGGEGAFVLVARDYSDFARAMSEKLEREIRTAPLTQNLSPGRSPDIRLIHAFDLATTDQSP